MGAPHFYFQLFGAKRSGDQVVASPSILFLVRFGANLQAAPPFPLPLWAIEVPSILFAVGLAPK